MPWTETDYPPAMKNLPAEVRRLAIRIANALLRQGHDEGSAIRIAIAQAKKARRRSLMRLAKSLGVGRGTRLRLW